MMAAPLLVLLAHCTPVAPAQTRVPIERKSQCVTACADLEMNLSAIVVMANNVGCVCEAATKTASHGGGLAGGAVTVMIQHQRQQQHAANAQAYRPR